MWRLERIDKNSQWNNWIRLEEFTNMILLKYVFMKKNFDDDNCRILSLSNLKLKRWNCQCLYQEKGKLKLRSFAGRESKTLNIGTTSFFPNICVLLSLCFSVSLGQPTRVMRILFAMADQDSVEFYFHRCSRSQESKIDPIESSTLLELLRMLRVFAHLVIQQYIMNIIMKKRNARRKLL